MGITLQVGGVPHGHSHGGHGHHHDHDDSHHKSHNDHFDDDIEHKAVAKRKNINVRVSISQTMINDLLNLLSLSIKGSIYSRVRRFRSKCWCIGCGSRYIL